MIVLFVALNFRERGQVPNGGVLKCIYTGLQGP